jgi:hypothetical protein
MFYADKSYLTFYEAHIVCKDFYNATLVSIHSEEEQLFLTNLAFTINKANNHVWIGARRISNNTFIWEDKSPFNYTNWAKTQPNNLEGKHYCASLLQSANSAELGNWYDDPCADKYNFICQTYIEEKPSDVSDIPPKAALAQRNVTTARITFNEFQTNYNKSLRANSTTISALIASSLNNSPKDQQKSNPTNVVLIIVTIVQFFIIASLIFVLFRKTPMFPPYRTLVMSECNRNSP